MEGVLMIIFIVLFVADIYLRKFLFQQNTFKLTYGTSIRKYTYSTHQMSLWGHEYSLSVLVREEEYKCDL